MTRLSRRHLVLAAAFFAASVSAAHAQSGPTAPVAALNQAILQVMKAGRATPFAQRDAIMRPVIEQSFALETIVKASVGLRYNSLPPAQQSELLSVFTDYTVASYVSNFDSYSGERLEMSPTTRPSGKDQVVSTQIIPTNGSPTRLDYVVRQEGGGWRIVDVLADGSISRVAVQRSDFRSLLSGGSAEPLINSLKSKTQRLAAGEKP